jgi:hypothetical protein
MDEVQELSADEVFGFVPDNAFFEHIEVSMVSKDTEFARCAKCKEMNEVGTLCCNLITQRP